MGAVPDFLPRETGLHQGRYAAHVRLAGEPAFQLAHHLAHILGAGRADMAEVSKLVKAKLAGA